MPSFCWFSVVNKCEANKFCFGVIKWFDFMWKLLKKKCGNYLFVNYLYSCFYYFKKKTEKNSLYRNPVLTV